jgi:choline kinase
MKTKTAIILAAGRGSRMEHLTQNLPKCLVSIGQETLLSRMLKQLHALQIKRIVLVVGYQSQKILAYAKEHFPEISLEFIDNSEWQTTNNIVSLGKAMQVVQENFILLESDLIVSTGTLEAMMYPNKIALGNLDPGMEGSVVCLDDNWKAKTFAKYSIDKVHSNTQWYKTINMYSFQWEIFAECVLPELSLALQKGVHHWFYEQAIAKALQKHALDLEAVVVENHQWWEIDTPGDLEKFLIHTNTKNLTQA